MECPAISQGEYKINNECGRYTRHGGWVDTPPMVISYNMYYIYFHKAIFAERKYISDVEFSHHEMRVFRLERDWINNNNGGGTGEIKTLTYIFYNNIIL